MKGEKRHPFPGISYQVFCYVFFLFVCSFSLNIPEGKQWTVLKLGCPNWDIFKVYKLFYMQFIETTCLLVTVKQGKESDFHFQRVEEGRNESFCCVLLNCSSTWMRTNPKCRPAYGEGAAFQVMTSSEKLAKFKKCLGQMESCSGLASFSGDPNTCLQHCHWVQK